LTQTIDENDQLIGVKEKVNFEEREVADNANDMNVNLRNELLKSKSD
jgi:hypothetical protein